MEGTPRTTADYRLSRLDGEILLYHPGHTKVLYLNETASLIWQLCDGVRTAEAITEILREAFPEQEASIPGEVETALRHLLDEGAIELV